MIDDEVDALPLLPGSMPEPDGAAPTTTGAVMIGVVPVSERVPAELVLVTGVLPAVVVMPVNGPVPVVVAPVTEVAPGDVPVTENGVLADVVPVLAVKPVLLFAAVPAAPAVPVVVCVAGTVPVAASGGAVPELSLLPPQPNRPAVAVKHASQPRRSEWVIAFSKLMLLGAPQRIRVEENAHPILSDIKPGWERCA